MPIFALPLAFLGMIALPGVAAIYLLRSRSRKFVVSSLMLWADQHKAKAGGLKLQRIQTPLLLLLELVAIALLVLAATGPRIPTDRNTRPLMIILDDSYSMQAGGSQSPRHLAAEAIERELDTGRHIPVQFILAGREPRVLGRPVRTTGQALKTIESWKCESPSADLDAAVSLASALGDQARPARILVVSDRRPTNDIEPGPLEWLALGRSRMNIAFTNAVRSSDGLRHRCLLELANFSQASKTVTLTLGESPSQTRKMVTIDAGARKQVRLDLKTATLPLKAAITEDELGIDNSVVLLPQTSRLVRVDLRVGNEMLRKTFADALEASGRATISATTPQLVITDATGPTPRAAGAWVLHLVAEEEVSSFVGPFVVDRSHPLTSGLSLAGVVWSAGKDRSFPGNVVVAAGNVPLLTEIRRAGGRRELRLRIRCDLSTVQNSANWPIFIWNLLEYRASRMPGLRLANVRLGSQVRLNLPTSVTKLFVTSPDGHKRERPVSDAAAVIAAAGSGVYRIDTGAKSYSFASNALHPAESDLRNCESGRWGSWLDEKALRNEYTPIAWVFLLCAVAMLCGHMAIVARTSRGASQ